MVFDESANGMFLLLGCWLKPFMGSRTRFAQIDNSTKALSLTGAPVGARHVAPTEDLGNVLA